MPRKRRGPRSPTVSLLATCLLLLPITLASPQQKQKAFRNSPPEDDGTDRAASALSSKGIDLASFDALRYHTEHDDTIQTDRSGAIATLAPASNNAVRAPRPAEDSTAAGGLSSLQHARSLQDWEVEDLILLATVDGSLYAMNRTTGAEKWNLIMEKPMVESVYHRENSASSALQLEEDSLWIVEPSKEGDIYRYSYQPGQKGGLQRMGFTVKKLSEHLSPFAAEDVVFTADKKTTLYTVDAATGTITKEFKPGGSSMFRSDEQSCRRVIGLESEDDDECGSSGSMILGRTEYTVGIHERTTTEPICTLTYSEWGPNNRDADLHSQYEMTMDNKYVYSRHDGNIFRFDHTRSVNPPKELYRRRLPSPVVRVFDIAKPTTVDGEYVGRDTQLVVLPQPTAPIRADDLWETEEERNRIFVNQTQGGGWFAMSEYTYPLVTGGAQRALCYHDDFPGFHYSLEGLSKSERNKALVGVHSLSERPTRNAGFAAIGGPTPDQSNKSPGLPEPQHSPMTSNFVLKNSKIIQTASDLHTADAIILAVVAIIISLIVSASKWQDFFRRILKSQQINPPIEQQITSPPTSPIGSKAPELPILGPVAREADFIPGGHEREDGLRTPTAGGLSPIDSNEDLRSPVSSDADGEERGRDAYPHVRIVEPSPSPSVFNETEDGNETPTPRKKARRGTRGGTKHKKNKPNQLKQLEKSEAMQDATAVQEAVEEALRIGEETKAIEPDIEVVSGSENASVADVSGPTVQIGHLRVHTDVILGYGSQGTVVYKGAFGGRDVAVKRMLHEFYDIASHEVGLLQESDDHPNVIRYYDKESSGEFLYIALELCPASLQEVVEKPQAYPSLIGAAGLDPPDVLKQITAGLRYLHSLKIIHRDIKPQNILMSAPRKLPTAPDIFQPPRLLISDFGLCKKLEGDQSSFRATTAHAAGTSGWRAPELLVDEDAVVPNGASNGTTSQSSAPSSTTMTSAHSASEPLVLDTQSNRRATRAIDIFSLGCVFYYVLTGGAHPFDRDGKYMREANIVKGHYNLSDLDRLGDYQWEAKDLVARMLSLRPRDRPDAAHVLAHPFFWTPATRLEFLCNVSDAFEFEPRDPPSAALQTLEDAAGDILGPANGDFLRVLPAQFKDTLGKQRKYTGGRVLDLLRALRNKKNHYEDMPDNVKKMVGPLPNGYLGFWTRRFPELLMACHEVVKAVGWEDRDRFKHLFAV